MCLPLDLEILKIEKAVVSKNEHYVFALTDKDRNRVYGICMRGLFRGENRRYDVKRRIKHCLCFITRQPLFSLFRSILQQLHSLSLLELEPGRAKDFLKSLSEQYVGNNLQNIIIPSRISSTSLNDFVVKIPKNSTITSYRSEVSILPLLEKLGVETFLKLLSAALCEKRIIFIADEVEELSSSVLALASMLHPFQWQHIFIPLLPSKLLSYAAAPVPYIIGVRKYLKNALFTEALEDVVIVDFELVGKKKKGEEVLYCRGNVGIKDFMGDSASTLKQTTEKIDVFIGKATNMANMLMGKSVDVNDQDSGRKDIVANMVNDLRAILSSKPGNSSLSLVTTSVLRIVPGTGEKLTTEEMLVRWNLDSEKQIRETLMQFYIYLFADMEDFVIKGGKVVAGGKSKSKSNFSDGDTRSNYDLKGYMEKRASMGDSHELLDFFEQFTHSQMFERFCDERYNRRKTKQQSSVAPSPSRGNLDFNGISAPEWDDYDTICNDMKSSKLVATVANVKTVVTAASTNHLRSLYSGDKESSSKGFMGALEFYPLAVQMTAGILVTSTSVYKVKENVFDVLLYIDGYELNALSVPSTASNTAFSRHTHGFLVMMDTICQACKHSDIIPKVMRTISVRLRSCIAAGCRGSGGAYGQIALVLLKYLLLNGPECTLSYALDLIPTIRKIINISTKLNNEKNSDKDSSSVAAVTQTAFDFMSNGSAIFDIKVGANIVLNMLLDHKRFTLQRLYNKRAKDGMIPYLVPTFASSVRQCREVFGKGPNKQFIKFGDIHNMMNPVHIDPSVNYQLDPTLVQLTPQVSISSLQRSMSSDRLSSKKSSPKKQSIVIPPASPSLLNDEDDNAKYRCINQETGAYYDLRDLEQLAMNTSQLNQKPHIPVLSPPPSKPPKASSSVKSKTKTTDPFQLETFLFGDPFSGSKSSAASTIVATNGSPSKVSQEDDHFTNMVKGISVGPSLSTVDLSTKQSKTVGSDPTVMLSSVGSPPNPFNSARIGSTPSGAASQATSHLQTKSFSGHASLNKAPVDPFADLADFKKK